MSRKKTDPLKLNNAVQLYLSGQSVKEAAADIGISRDIIYAELRRRGIKPPGNRHDIPADTIRSLYVDEGKSELAVADHFGVSRPVIRRRLQELGIKVRSIQEANAARIARLSTDQRADLTRAANGAARGRVRTFDERCKVAATREARRSASPASIGETELLELLSARGLDPIQQKAVGPYNLDFAIGTVAVEVLGGAWHAGKAVHAERTPYILNQGWTLVFLWRRQGASILPQAADYIVTLTQQASIDPTLTGQYRVIRSDGQLAASGSLDDDDFALVLPSIRSLNYGA